LLILLILNHTAAVRAAITVPQQSKMPGAKVPPQYRSDRLLAKPKAQARFQKRNEIAAAHAALGLQLQREFPRLGGLQALRLPKGLTVEEAIARLQKTGFFEYVEPDYRVHLLLVPNDPKFADGSLWGLNNTGQDGGTVDADIDAPEAWDTRTDAVWVSGNVTNEVIVGIIDTGMDYTHPDLIANLWTNPCVNCPVNGIVYTNDLHGINAITGSGDPLDDHFHGTHVAGTIGATGNNNHGVVGVAWRVKLMALKFLDSTGSGDVSDAVACIDYAVAKGANVLNNSWGGGAYSQALVDAIQAARDAGIIFVVAAGNESNDNDLNPTYPASYTNDNVVAIMATDRNDKGSVFGETFLGTRASNYGYESVKLGAPGKTIWSTFPTYTTAEMTSNSMPTMYYRLSGTSMATPHVAGAFALLKAQYPAETHQQLIARLSGTTDPLDDLIDACYTQGRLNLAQALTNLPAPITRFRTYPLASTYYNTLHFTGGSPPLSVLCSNETAGAASYSWNFGDGSPLVTNFSPTYVYSNAGTYLITLTAISTNGRSRSLTRQVVVDQNYKMDAAAPFAWINPAGHTAISLSDQSWSAQALPFPFLFYGRTNTIIYIGSNGQLGFETNGLPNWSGYPPDPDAPNNIIYVMCQDLDPGAGGGSVTVGTVGSAPNRIQVVTWNNIKHKSFTDRFTFQALLYENNGDIKLQYLDTAPNGDSQIARGAASTVGLEHPTGWIAKMYRQATDSVLLNIGQAILFSRHPVSIATNIAILVSGNSNGSIDPGETWQETIVLSNEMNQALSDVTATLTTTNVGVNIFTNTSAYPNMSPFGSSTNSIAYRYKIGRDVPWGTLIEFQHTVTVAATGQTHKNTFWRRVGRLGGSVTNTIASSDTPRSIVPGTGYPNFIYGITLSTNFAPLAGYLVDDVNVSVRINHADVGWLDLVLISPSGAELKLAESCANGPAFGSTSGGLTNYTVFDDAAAIYLCNASAPYVGPVRPEYTGLANFNGQNAGGNWRLKLIECCGGTGTLLSWKLHLVASTTNYVCEPYGSCSSNTTPVANSQVLTVAANASSVLTLTGGDADNDPLTFITNSLPAHGVLSAFNPVAGQITYIPTPGYLGADSFTFRAADGCANSSIATISFNVVDPYAAWQSKYFPAGGPTAAGGADPDGDGLSNTNEFLAGFNPTNGTASLRILSIAISNGNAIVTYQGANGDTTWTPGISARTNVLERATTFVFTGQSNILSGGTGIGVVTNMIDPGAATNPARFYRVRLLVP
jgi:subtilisin family serine protease/subtilisin-like proprotein convertase family protein